MACHCSLVSEVAAVGFRPPPALPATLLPLPRPPPSPPPTADVGDDDGDSNETCAPSTLDALVLDHGETGVHAAHLGHELVVADGPGIELPDEARRLEGGGCRAVSLPPSSSVVATEVAVLLLVRPPTAAGAEAGAGVGGAGTGVGALVGALVGTLVVVPVAVVLKRKKKKSKQPKKKETKTTKKTNTKTACRRGRPDRPGRQERPPTPRQHSAAFGTWTAMVRRSDARLANLGCVARIVAAVPDGAAVGSAGRLRVQGGRRRVARPDRVRQPRGRRPTDYSACSDCKTRCVSRAPRPFCTVLSRAFPLQLSCLPPARPRLTAPRPENASTNPRRQQIYNRRVFFDGIR